MCCINNVSTDARTDDEKTARTLLRRELLINSVIESD